MNMACLLYLCPRALGVTIWMKRRKITALLSDHKGYNSGLLLTGMARLAADSQSESIDSIPQVW
ncbi:hypothetical protein ES706_06532 [subsurface metagenome]